MNPLHAEPHPNVHELMTGHFVPGEQTNLSDTTIGAFEDLGEHCLLTGRRCGSKSFQGQLDRNFEIAFAEWLT